MIDINLLRENPDRVKEGIQKKGYDVSLVDEVISLDQKYREILKQVEDLRAERNKAAKEQNIERGREIKEELKDLEPKLDEIEKKLQLEMYKIPNLPLEDVPLGKDESENVVLRKWGEPKKFTFKPKDHLELGEALGIIDVENAAKVTGTRFAYLKGDGALLEFALIQHTIKVLTAEGFIPVIPPVMIKPKVFARMGRLSESDKDERYHLEKDDLYLVGSAEHTLGPLHMDETIPETKLPVRYIGFSTSFRREAGSYGQDTKGIIRVHQFDKLEMETFTLPEDSVKEQDYIVSLQEKLMQSLEIPYQIVAICTGDMAGPDARQIDIEAWMPGQDKYRETHTSDLMTDYQSRRLNTRVQRKNGETEFVHMNDATAFAIGRIIVAILENNQQEDGSISIPEVLRPYMGSDTITSK